MDKIHTLFEFSLNVDLSLIFSANYDEHGMLVDENGDEVLVRVLDDLIWAGWVMPGSIYSKEPYSEEFSEWFTGRAPAPALGPGRHEKFAEEKQQELLKREHAYRLSLKNESNDDSSSDVEVVDVVTPQDKENIARAATIEID